MDDDALLDVLRRCAEEVRTALDTVTDWRRPGERPSQYAFDLVADGPAVAVLVGAGLGVLSEESGLHHPDREVVVVIDPVDGSTNASRGIPWFATSLCAVDQRGARVALVGNQATGAAYHAVRGGGAFRDGRPISPSGQTSFGHAMVGLAGHPHEHLGWAQYRALGAAALDLCAVAEGTLDAYLDCTRDAHGPWDYLGGMLVVREAGGAVADAYGRDLVTLVHDERRTPLGAATAELLDGATAARLRLDRAR